MSFQLTTRHLFTYDTLVFCLQVLRRKERDCEHEMERLAREKIAAQQRLSALKREISVRTTVRPRSIGALTSYLVMYAWYIWSRLFNIYLVSVHFFINNLIY